MQKLLTCVVHLKSLVIVTPKIFNAFNIFKVSSLQGIWSMDLLDPFSCQLHHIAFDRLKSHTQLPCPGTQSINIPLKCHCVYFILNFTIANIVSAKSLISDSISDEMSFMYRENNKGLRMVPWGTPYKTGAQSDLTPFTTTRCCLKQRKESIHFNVFPPIP